MSDKDAWWAFIIVVLFVGALVGVGAWKLAAWLWSHLAWI